MSIFFGKEGYETASHTAVYENGIKVTTMNAQEAAQAARVGRKVRRKAWSPGYWEFNTHGGVKNDRGITYQLKLEDLAANDWEAEPSAISVTKEKAVEALLESHFHTRSAVPSSVMDQYLKTLGFK